MDAFKDFFAKIGVNFQVFLLNLWNLLMKLFEQTGAAVDKVGATVNGIFIKKKDD